jgi:hypothetical protein
MVPLALIVAAAAAQAPQGGSPPRPTVGLHTGHSFMSPMGEPFFGRVAGEDGLTVWFEQADRNHDGSLTSAEMTADADHFFQALDTNHDGEIDPDEIAHYEGAIAPGFQVQTTFSSVNLPGGEQQVHFDDESGAGSFSLLQIPEPVSSADTNFNRGVSPDEFAKAATDRFKLLDINHTGRLNLPDLENIRHAAAASARKRRTTPSSPADNGSSAEYGTPAPL